MHAPITWTRILLAAAVFVGAVTGVARPNQASLVKPLTIHGQFKGQAVMLTATDRSAGAIESLQWGGMEFLDASDHGRHLQSALSFDGLTECDNPTEAGSRSDGAGASSSSSRLTSSSVTGNVLRTRSQMAYWLRLGQRSAACGYAKNETSSPVSSTRLSKSVRFLPGFGNVLQHRISFSLSRPRALAQFEVLTAYMPAKFADFYQYNVTDERMQPLSDGPGEQGLPVVLATDDGTHALGLFTPQAATESMAGPGYGRWRFNNERVTKSNLVFRVKNAAAGSYDFLVYTVFGTLEDVKSTLSTLYKSSRQNVAEIARPLDAEASLDALARN